MGQSAPPFLSHRNSVEFPMRQKASGRMRSSRKGKSLRDSARARRVRKRTLFYTGDGPVSQYLRQVFLLAESGTEDGSVSHILWLFFFLRKLGHRTVPCCSCHSSKKRKRASTDRGEEKSSPAQEGRKAESGNGRLPIEEREKSSPPQENKKRK